MKKQLTYKQLQQKLEQMDRELQFLREDASKVQNAFLSNISHEVRTPLNAIVGFADLVAEDRLTIKEKKELAGFIKCSSDTLLELINNLTDISLILAGKLPLTIENCNSEKIVEAVINKFTSLHYGYEVYHNICKDGVPVFKSDEFRITQVFLNLLQFISQFSTKGKLQISYKAIDNNINFEILILGHKLDVARKELLRALNSLKNSGNIISINLAVQASVYMANCLQGEILIKESWKDDWGIVISIPKKITPHNKSKLQIAKELLKKGIAF